MKKVQVNKNFLYGKDNKLKWSRVIIFYIGIIVFIFIVLMAWIGIIFLSNRFNIPINSSQAFSIIVATIIFILWCWSTIYIKTMKIHFGIMIIGRILLLIIIGYQPLMSSILNFLLSISIRRTLWLTLTTANFLVWVILFVIILMLTEWKKKFQTKIEYENHINFFNRYLHASGAWVFLLFLGQAFSVFLISYL